MCAQVIDMAWISQDPERQESAAKMTVALNSGVLSSIPSPLDAAYTEQPRVEGNPHRRFQFKNPLAGAGVRQLHSR
jgi:hypothetical protein